MARKSASRSEENYAATQEQVRAQGRPAPSGRNTTTKTINVEVRKKRTYVRRAEVEAEEARVQQEAEAEAEAENQLLQQEEAEEAQRQAEEAAKAAEAEGCARRRRKKRPAPKPRRKLTRKACRKPRQPSRSSKSNVAEAEAAEAAEQAAPRRAGAGGCRQCRGDHRRRKPASTANTKTSIPATAARNCMSRNPRTQPNRKQKFKKGPEAGARNHAISTPSRKPTAPVVRNVEVPEAITVAELAQRMAVKAGDVIKVLMQMGTMATINEVLDRDTATLVVEELGPQCRHRGQRRRFRKGIAGECAEQEGGKACRSPARGHHHGSRRPRQDFAARLHPPVAGDLG